MLRYGDYPFGRRVKNFYWIRFEIETHLWLHRLRRKRPVVLFTNTGVWNVSIIITVINLHEGRPSDGCTNSRRF